MVNATGDALTVTCKVCFAGELKPRITCHNSFLADESADINTSQLVAKVDDHDRCRFYSQQYASDKRVRGSTFKCSVIFESYQRRVLYNFTWTSPPINFTCTWLIISYHCRSETWTSKLIRCRIPLCLHPSTMLINLRPTHGCDSLYQVCRVTTKVA